jgi:alpha-N-arabinofuranosidase
MLKPQYHIMLANYWHFLNGHFAMVQGADDAHLVNHPAYPLMRLWAQYFEGQLLDTAVKDSPTITAESFLRSLPASGTQHTLSKPLSADNLFVTVPTQGNDGENIHWSLSSEGVYTMQLNGQNKSAYPHFAQFNIPDAILKQQVGEYRVTCEMKYEPGANSEVPGHIGLGVEDGRGWNKTHSALAMAVTDMTGRWHTVVGEYQPLPDTTTLGLLARLNIDKQTITGTLSVRNIRIIPYTGEHFPAYQAITATSAISNDGKILSIMVMNKHQSDNISVDLVANGFAATSGQYWQVSGPSLAATNTPQQTQVSQTVDGQSLTTEQLTHFACKPLSMTVIQLHR